MWSGAVRRRKKKLLQARRASQLSLPVCAEQLLDNGGISERRGVAEFVDVHLLAAVAYLAQNSAHDLAAAGLWQRRSPVDDVRRGDGADLFAHELDERLSQFFARVGLVHERHVRIDSFALDVVSDADHGGLGNVGVQDQGGLDLGRPNAVSTHVENVVHPPGQPVVTILVAPASVARHVVPGASLEERGEMRGRTARTPVHVTGHAAARGETYPLNRSK
mmetsp:Transcript_9504/g.28708  ORF Transcript_9504/g.28708 Transcript_9504/m.28708 type:complete len:220 (-) Transcript_9504:1835-2494(-)